MPKTVQEQFISTNKYPKIPGITWNWERRKWKVQMRFQGKNQVFGRYDNFYEAYYTLCIAKDIYG